MSVFRFLKARNRTVSNVKSEKKAGRIEKARLIEELLFCILPLPSVETERVSLALNSRIAAIGFGWHDRGSGLEVCAADAIIAEPSASFPALHPCSHSSP